MATSSSESFQWLSVTEESLFLHDGLLRVTDLVELPNNVETFGSRDNEVVSFDSKDPEELCAKLLEICSLRNDAFNTILEYRLNALKGLWKAQKLFCQDDQVERDGPGQDETISLLRKQGLLKDSEQAPFSTRISLLLILPLLQSQSKSDPSLCTVTSGVILACLRDCPPLSLAKEPVDCLNGLESLLCGWLGEQDGSMKTCIPAVAQCQRENAAAALIALACARGHVKTFTHAIDLLQQLDDIPPLQVNDTLKSLIECEGGQGQITSFLGSKYILSWGLDDLLGPSSSDDASLDGKESNEKDKDKDLDLGRSIASDGYFLYTTNNFGKGVAKIGTGLQGTLRGYVYNKNTELGPGRLASGGDFLLLRPQSFDAETETDLFVQIIDKDTLEVLKVISKPKAFVQMGPCTTVGFCSDGLYCYWLWCPALLQDKSAKSISVNLCTFMVERDLEVRQLRPVVTLQKKEEAASRNMNEAILNRLRPLRGSTSAATLMALTGGETLIPSRKEDSQNSGTTSCGVSLRTLIRTPIYSDGNHIVLLALPPGSGPSGVTSRSLFGGAGSGPISSLRSLASNMCFSTKTGVFCARYDLVEAHTSSLGRGASLTSLATCFDPRNNLLWMSSGEYVDQFHNPSNMPPHHIHHRLGIMEPNMPTGLGGNCLPVDLVVNVLLHNVSSMCLHQMTNTASSQFLRPPTSCGGASSSLSAHSLDHQIFSQTASMAVGISGEVAGGSSVVSSSFTPQPTALDFVHLGRVTSILARAVSEKDTQAVICCLVMLEHIFKNCTPCSELDTETKQIEKTRSLIWTLLTDNPLGEEDKNLVLSMKTELCRVITVGLQYLYPTQQERHALLYQLLTSGNENPALVELRNMILTEFAAQLSHQSPHSTQDSVLQLSDDLIHYVLKLAVKESSSLLKSVQTSNKDDFQKKILNLPVASPAVQYLMALRSFYLKCAVLFVHPSYEEKNSKQGTALSGEALNEIQSRVLSLSSKMIAGACEVLEHYLETCSIILGGFVTHQGDRGTSTKANPPNLQSTSSYPYIPSGDMESWLLGLERLAKSTILGFLLPVLVTALTHPNMRGLELAQELTPSLVQLSLLASQAALLLKDKETAPNDHPLPSPDIGLASVSDVADLIGEALNSEYFEGEEDEGFLAGLKIPTPWASGKTLETIHPVRDNYKFKDTVHIPGARCLYLRFDPRCSSQYDYDKVIVHAGPGINGKKIAEYGGNTFGYGSRSVLGNGWPKDLVKVEGDTVTLTFEMRSGREHNTPDKAMWGFACTIRAQENAEEVSPGLPFLCDLALGLSVLVRTQLEVLYHGLSTSEEETQCQHLLRSRMLQRCVWPTELSYNTTAVESGEVHSQKPSNATPSAGVTSPPLRSTKTGTPGTKKVATGQQSQTEKKSNKPVRSRLSPVMLEKLRKLAKRQQPLRLRASVRAALQPELLEESVLSAVLTHLGLTELVHDLDLHSGQEELATLVPILEEIYHRLDVLFRKLQVVAELEKRWEIEVEDNAIQLLEAAAAPHQQPGMKTLAASPDSVSSSSSGSSSETLVVGSTVEPPFFHDFHLQELRHKELALLAFLKDAPVDAKDMEATTKVLLNKFEGNVLTLKEKKQKLNRHKKDATDRPLIEEEEIDDAGGTDEGSLAKTKQVVAGILSRLELLLQVRSVPTLLPRTFSSCGPDSSTDHTQTSGHHLSEHNPQLMAHSDTDVRRPGQSLSRSLSAPVSAAVAGLDMGLPLDSPWDNRVGYNKWRQSRHKATWSTTALLSDLLEGEDASDESNCEDKGRAPHVVVVEQLFAFIGSEPEKAVSCEKFLHAAENRRLRGLSRKSALSHVRDLLASAAKVGGGVATHLVAAAAAVLRHGPRVEDLLCGGLVDEVREAFAQAMAQVVQLAAQSPKASACSVGLLCTIPYTRAEEKCLVRSGLVQLLDRLCSLGDQRADGLGAEAQTPRQKVSALAWAGFQVLASRCVKWENDDASSSEDLEHSGLAKQVSMLLTHHLARATEGSGNAMASTEALQEVLSLLNNLSRSKMGKAILSQPACVSKLLSLLLDQRPSPKLVLITLQLCRVSLPLMNVSDCAQVELPAWGQQLYQTRTSGSGAAELGADPPARIICLLLAKLGDFLVPGDQVLLSSRSPSHESPGASSNLSCRPGDQDRLDDLDLQRGRLSVFVHKRQDQLSHDIIQPLLNCDMRPQRLAGNANMEKVRALDREINKNGKAELTTEDAVNAFKKAFKWAQLGLMISTAPPTNSTSSDNNNGSDKKKVASDVICKEKNSELARMDPVRAFISGNVANAMAAEVIALLHNLLSAHTSSTAQTWSQAVQRVLANALSGLPSLLGSLEGLASPRSPRGAAVVNSGGSGTGSVNYQLMSLAKLANAALCALGGFQETLKPGCEVKVTGEGVLGTYGTVLSVSEQNDVVTVQLCSSSSHSNSGGGAGDGYDETVTFSDTIKVPMARIHPVRNEMFCKHQPGMTEAFLSAAKAVILPPDEVVSPMMQALHCSGDGNAMANQICRVIAEIRTRTSIVLARCLRDIQFAKEFIEECGYSIDMLKSLAKDCDTGSRLCVMESHCHRLRMLYRDCAKPPPPPSRTDVRPSKEMVWDVQRSFPPTRACLFSHGMTAALFLGDPSAGVGLPRGTMIYANQPIPREAPSFYWELEVTSFGDSQDESGAVVSFGFAPPVEKKDGAWTNPVGTCLFLNNGKAVHYNGSSLLQWRSVRLEVTISAGDVAGIGWERSSESANTDSGQIPKGQVYFTYNGRRLSASLDGVAGALYPVVHMQKKGCRVKANFGSRPFAYAEGQQHREAAEEANDVLRDIRESFSHLPFSGLASGGGGGSEDSESDSAEPPAAQSWGSGSIPGLPDLKESRGSSPQKLPCSIMTQSQPQHKDYSVEASQYYKLLPCFDNLVVTGPDSLFTRPSEEDSDDEGPGASANGGDDSGQLEDHYALLVKAWEQKVFPVIRRRFRNEAERKDGLEQIRGALQLGMTDIARQTVEFLYEENGGIPRDLHLPTIDDIKEDLAKFTIDRVKKGTTVIIRTPQGMGGVSGGTSGSGAGAAASSNTSAATTTTTSNATMQLPKFAVRSMLKTFGLTGTVLDIDSANELVQVESYLRSEGVLVRFWYPLAMLEKPAQGMRKASITGGQTMDTSNIYIHRELLATESVLARMYLRTAFLRLTDHCNSPAMEVTSCSANIGSGMAACAATLQELDLENIELLSEHLLSPPSTTGTLEANSPFQIRRLSQLGLNPQISLPSLVYSDSLRLQRQLATAIARASNQGEDYLTELTSQLCMCLQTAPEMFPFAKFPVNETKVSTDVHFSGAACILVSCQRAEDSNGKETPPYRAPWARISTYTGKRIRKSGQVTRQEVLCYPRDLQSGHSSCGSDNDSHQFAPAIIPGNRVYVKIGVSPPPGVVVMFHALPPQFLLAVAYVETLVTESFGCGMLACGAGAALRLDKQFGGAISAEADESQMLQLAMGTKAASSHDREGNNAAVSSDLTISSHSSSSSSYSSCPQQLSLSSSSASSPTSASARGMMLSLHSGEFGGEASSPSLWSLENICITPSVFLHVVELLCTFLWRTDAPALAKEFIFHLLAQTLRMLKFSEYQAGDGTAVSRLASKLSARPSPTQGVLLALPRELKNLYNLEVKLMPQATTSVGHGVGLGVTDTGRWSTYLQGLFEVCLAVVETLPAELLQQHKDPAEAASVSGESGATGISAAPPETKSGSSSGKKKKLKPKKERTAASASLVRRSSQEHQQLSALTVSEVEDVRFGAIDLDHACSLVPYVGSGSMLSSWDTGAGAKPTSSNTSMCSLASSSSSSAASASSIKLDDMPWFTACVSACKVLRHLGAQQELYNQEDVTKAVNFAAASMATPITHARILILTGIPTFMDKAVVERSLRKICKSHGGLDENCELFVPTPADIQILDHLHEERKKEKKEDREMGLSLNPSLSTAGIVPTDLAMPTDLPVSHISAAPNLYPIVGTNDNANAIDTTVTSPARTAEMVLPWKLQKPLRTSKSIEGYAVLCLPSKTKTEVVSRALLKTKWLDLGEMEAAELVAAGLGVDHQAGSTSGGGGLDEDDIDGAGAHSLLDVPEENLSVHTVNQQLVTEPQANLALDKFLLSKLSTYTSFTSNSSDQVGVHMGEMGSFDTEQQGTAGAGKISPGRETKSTSSKVRSPVQEPRCLNVGACQALTEIFYTCYFQSPGQQDDAGDICLNRDQLLNPAPENLLSVFFNAVRPAKKSLGDAVSGVLKRYGIVKSSDKEGSPPSSDKTSKSKPGKKPASKSSKEKMAQSPSGKDQEEKSQSMDKENEKDADKEDRDKSEKSVKDKEGAGAHNSWFFISFPKGGEGRLLTLSAFIKFCEDLMKQDLRALWRGFFSCGFDLVFERCWCPDQATASQMMSEWTPERDVALVHHVNQMCTRLAMSSAKLHPHELRLSPAQLANETFTPLQGLPVESLRLRLAFLQHLNACLETSLLPLVDLRPSHLYSRSLASLLAQLRGVIFYDTKVNFFNRVLNASTKRKPDQAAPEITLNPLEIIGTGDQGVQQSIFCQSYRQLSSLSSKKLCVRLASGGDPTYSFNVRMTGEEVHGTSGSFRHYLWQVARELQSPGLSLLMPCPGSVGSGAATSAGSSSTTSSKGRLILKPGKMTYSEECLLIFVGQLLGITMRADIPLGLDLLSPVWKLLVGMTLDPYLDLQEADAVTYKYIKRIELAESESELEAVLGEANPRFVYTALTGLDVDLVSGGHNTSVCWSNRQAYTEAIKHLRLHELSSSHRIRALTTGLASIMPSQVLSLFTPKDLELRTSGQPTISLDFLKSHTMYQVGLVESDAHIQHFWSALESFSQEELARFIKFACNQERIPQTCPCQEGGPDSAHVPPYPMKIAPPDGSGPPDGRHIRVETCMFMVKLPQYSSLEVMATKLRYAINCREDPLSG